MTRGNDVSAEWEYTDRDGDLMIVRHDEGMGEVDFITYMHDATPGQDVSGFVSISEPGVPGLIEFLSGIVSGTTDPADPEPVSPVRVQAVDVEDVGTGITVEFFVVSVGFRSEPITTRSVALLVRGKMIADGPHDPARIIRRTVIDEDVTWP